MPTRPQPTVPAATHVVCVPAGHPYVASSIATPGVVDDGVLVLPDVVPAGRPAGQWWPPVALDPAVLAGWLDGDGHPLGGRVDVIHVHFGVEGVPLDDLEACLALAREHGVALVVTVHDLRNPHLADDAGHTARLDRLVRAADVVLTLTPAAADQVRDRWGRDATVVPHPHVAPLARIADQARPRPVAGPLRVGLPLKALRANTLTAAQVDAVAAAVRAAGAVLEVGVHPEVFDPGFVRHDAAMVAVLDRLAGAGGVEVAVHGRLDDDAYLDDLARHDVVVLPYRFGTHSGVLEACRDVATVAVAPTVGCYASQAPCPTYDPGDVPGTLPEALAAARSLLEGGPGALDYFVDRAGRADEARRVRRAHRDAYRAALAQHGSEGATPDQEECA